MTTVIALDVGGTWIKCGAAGPDGRLRAATRRPTGAEHGPQAVWATVLATARELAHRYRPVAVGVAIPGIVDERAGRSVLAANLGWQRLAVRDRLAEELGVPVALAHDVRAGGLAEARLGAGRGCGTFLFVPVGTGVAAAMVVDGRPLPGGHAKAGELGHLPVELAAGEPCGCGGRGCLETIASAAAIARRYTRRTGRTGTDAKGVAARARTGDFAAVTVWREAVEALAEGLAATVTLLDPARIVIGGGLAEAGEHHLAPLRSALAARLTFQTVPEIVPAQLGPLAGCHGAALLARELAEGAQP